MAQALSASDSNETIPPLVAGILDEFLQAIRPAMGLLLVVTILASMLIPLLITLFYLSDPPMRRKPIFILNGFSIVLGIAIAVWSDYIEVRCGLIVLMSCWLILFAAHVHPISYDGYSGDAIRRIRHNRASRSVAFGIRPYPPSPRRFPTKPDSSENTRPRLCIPRDHQARSPRRTHHVHPALRGGDERLCSDLRGSYGYGLSEHHLRSTGMVPTDF